MANFKVGLKLLCVIVITVILLPLHVIGQVFSKKLRQKIEMRWHKAMCFILGIDVKVHGTLAQQDGHGVLIAANHISYIDIIVLGSLAPLSFIAKEEVKSWPVFGALAKWQDCIFVDRDVRSGARKQAEEINARLAAGDNIVLFAEGTTSDGNFIYPFKSSLFGAIGVGGEVLKSPIQPVSIAYVSQHGLPMGRFARPRIAWPGDVEMGAHLLGVLRDGQFDTIVGFGAPITDIEGLNRKQITAQIEQRVAEMTSLALRGNIPLLNTDKTD